MSAELLLNVTPTETRVALIENGVLQELHIERQAKLGLVGNIYVGKVSRVLPGMQAAFVDIGLDKAAFLHASDIVQHDTLAELENKPAPSKDIRVLVREGQYLLVQVVKDPLGTKGARLTTDITLPSRYLVFMPGSPHVGVSQRLESEAERQRLKDIVSQYLDDSGGFIVRTAAEGAGEEELAQDAKFLKKLWAKVLKRKQKTRKEGVVYEDLTLAYRILRDFVGTELERVRVDSKLTFQQLTAFCEEFIPHLSPLLEYYPGERPGFLFDDIERAVHPVVSVDTLNILLADREATKVQLAELSQVREALRAAHEALAKEQAARGDASDTSREPGLRSETTYLNIIGGLLTLLLGKSPSGTAYSCFHSMDAVVSALLAHHEGRPGLSERTLWSKLAQARRHLEASR